VLRCVVCVHSRVHTSIDTIVRAITLNDAVAVFCIFQKHTKPPPTRVTTDSDPTHTGIVLPDSAQSKINRATVVAVGQGRKDVNGKLVPMSVKAGDTVLLSEVSITTIRTRTHK
jgi:co-chaperonin GroES (HSP10)